INDYKWEHPQDTIVTWRIDDGTSAFYNYIYMTVAGFTENDTFRSNQIREGEMTREDALQIVKEENKPRCETIEWYACHIGFDCDTAIKRINTMPKLYA
ncbi:MAG: glucosamine 6-phosphate synthetase, partial [Candidatus Omnitrophica bacterium]|nr:glucosamine 6-phosphate synthetase [Candidatus Omnitrophota bacterium]